ncbi:MAG TPA: EamA family transporter [Dehalococcoidia bacterium]|nr:EamA family transporter [Dehalococcoidia bacterium]
MLISISVLVLPLAAILIWRYPISYPGWWFIFGTAILHALYFVFLGRSYTYADLSLVYPVARGTGPALVPVIGVLLLKEILTTLAIVGIISVVLGIFTVYWWGQFQKVLHDPFRFFREAGARYALLTGLVIAVYSVWDKMGVSYVNPFLYMYFLVLGSTLFLAPYVYRTHGTKAIRTEMKENTGSIIISGLLLFIAYGLILFALQFSRVSYIAPAREVGIVIGVLLGTFMLGEPFGKGRVLGSCLIVFGLVLISLAP